MHPYLTERMLHQSPALAPLGAIAVQHRERLDGSGYPRGLAGAAISLPARILGAADAYQAMREPRPYRPALSADAAAAELRAEVAGRPSRRRRRRGRAGRRRPSRRRAAAKGPSGLTPREVEVLQAARARAAEQGDRRAPRDLAEDRRQPHRAHLPQDRRLEPRARRACSRCSTASSRRRSSRPPCLIALRRPASPACSSSSSPRRPAARRWG